MSTFRVAHPKHVQAKLNFYAEKDMKRTAAKAEKKQRAAVWTSSGEAGPSIIYVESSSGSELDDAFGLVRQSCFS
jgi:hypothetical protein